MLVIADPILPVPPVGYGGTERIVATLCKNLNHRGHEVTLMAHPASSVGTRLIPHSPPRLNSVASRARQKAVFFFKSMVAAADVDLVHSFGRTDYLLPILRWTQRPIVITFQNPIIDSNIRWLAHQRSEGIKLVSVSNAQRSAHPHSRRWSTVYNAIDTSAFPFSNIHPEEGYLAFLGRITAAKGVRAAIEVAKLSGRKLKIGGKPTNENGSERFFLDEIKPHLSDQIEWVGEVTEAAKGRFLGDASALLFPIQWEEPFGIVMPEALACGTPVIAFSRGSVPELVRHGETGFLAADINDMVRCVGRLSEISRSACRNYAVECFNEHRMVDDYLNLYRELLPNTA